jgi:hypothetical protein
MPFATLHCNIYFQVRLRIKPSQNSHQFQYMVRVRRFHCYALSLASS